MNKGILAVCVFLAILAFPLIYNAQSAIRGVSMGSPELAEGKGEECVKDEEWMKRNHMKLLMHVRDDVVRQGMAAGDNSLQGCVKCHPNRSQFCDRCHSYTGVNPECWRCHHYPA